MAKKVIGTAETKYILACAIEGWTIHETVDGLHEEYKISVGTSAVWAIRNKHRKKIAAALDDQMTRATALSPMASLDGRIAVLEKVVRLGLAEHQALSARLAEEDESPDAEKPMNPAMRAVIEHKIVQSLQAVNDAVKIADAAMARMAGLQQKMREYNAKQNLDSRDVVEETIIAVSRRVLTAQEKHGGRTMTLKELAEDIDWLSGEFDTVGDDEGPGLEDEAAAFSEDEK